MAKGIHDERYGRLIEELATARRRLRISQATLGERLGARQQYVSKYEAGERRLDVIEFLDAAAALGLDPLDLLRSVTSHIKS